eukprot:71318_1
MSSFLTTDIVVDVPPAQRFDESRLLQYLRDKVDIFPKQGSLVIKKFGFGQSNPTYLLQCKQMKLVLRKKPSGHILRSAHAIEREYRVMSALQNSRVPVPKTYVLCTDSSIIGTPFYIYEFIQGRVFTAAHIPSLRAQQRFAIYAELQKVLSAIHSVNLSEVGLSDYSTSTTDHVTRTINIWNKQFNASKSPETEAITELNSFYSKINDYQRNDTESNQIKCLVHGDFKLDNVVFDAKSLRILAVLDWELSTIGNPLTDVAGFCLTYYPLSMIGQASLFGRDLSKIGIPDERAFVNAWIQDLNVKTSKFIRNFTFPIKDFNFYLAVTVYRNIGIAQGVFKRIKDGNASDTRFAALSAKDVLTQMAKTGLSMLAEPDLYSKLLIIPKAVLSKNEADHLPPHLEPFREHFADSAFFDLRRRLLYLMDAYIYPAERQCALFYCNPSNERVVWPGLEPLKLKAKELKLWNLFLPKEYPEGAGLTNLQYAPLCEIMGRSLHFASEVCNCSAPDTGNMEVLAKYGNTFQKQTYLKPLLEGTIRSCFGMTEPAVASSDARNIGCSAIKSSDGKYYIVNGRKHWTSGAMDQRCKLCILMVKTDVFQTQYSQQSMLICPMNLKGVKIVRHLTVFGYSDLPHGHAEVIFDNVRVPSENLILGEGKGFEISQGRLGPGRIHHCMRIIGVCERALDWMKKRCLTRYAFGSMMAQKTSIQQDIADSRCEIEQARLLVLQTAAMMDKLGNKKARQWISMIKVVGPRMGCKIVDRAIQANGGLGVSQDTPLAKMYSDLRSLRLADGPDEVHQRVVARLELLNSKL